MDVCRRPKAREKSRIEELCQDPPVQWGEPIGFLNRLSVALFHYGCEIRRSACNYLNRRRDCCRRENLKSGHEISMDLMNELRTLTGKQTDAEASLFLDELTVEPPLDPMPEAIICTKPDQAIMTVHHTRDASKMSTARPQVIWVRHNSIAAPSKSLSFQRS
jgi:hypothetical protein